MGGAGEGYWRSRPLRPLLSSLGLVPVASGAVTCLLLPLGRPGWREKSQAP